MVVRSRSSIQEWIIYASVFIVLMTILSTIHSIGTLFPYFLDEFGESRAKTAAIQSVFFGVGLGCSIFTGLLVQHYGPRLCGILGAILFSTGLISSVFATSTTYLLITFGVISGLGGPPLLFLSCCQAVTFCFEGKTKLIAISVATSSVGVGAMVYPYVIKVTTDSYGVKGTMLILGGIALNSIPLAALWSEPKYRSLSKYGAETTTETGETLVNTKTDTVKYMRNADKAVTDTCKETHDDLEVYSLLTTNHEPANHENNNSYSKTTADNKNEANSSETLSDFVREENVSEGLLSKFLNTLSYRPYSVLVCAFACVLPAISTFEILFLDVLETNGLSRDHGITLLIILNGVCIPARIFPGFIHKIPRCSSGVGMIIGALVSMTGILLLNHTSGFGGNLISCILLGASKGILLGCVSVVPLEMLGPSRLSTAMGIISCVNGIASTAQGPLHGFLRDISGSYTITIYVSAGSMLLSVVFSTASMLLERRAASRKTAFQ